MANQTAISESRNSSLVGRRLLWAVVLITVVLNAKFLVPPMDEASRGAADFSIFYVGAKMLRTGWSHELYNLDSQARFQSAFYRSQPLPYNHPAYELLLFLAPAALSFSSAYYTWMCINLAMLLVIAATLSERFETALLRNRLFIFLTALAFLPVCICLLQGQDSILLLVIYSATYLAMKRQRDLAAGMLLSLGAFKFMLVLPFLIPFLVRRYWKFVGGFVSGAVILAGISVAITGVSGSLEYVSLLRLLLRRPELGYIRPVLMPNLRGVLLSGGISGFSTDRVVVALSAIIVAAAAMMMVRPEVRDRRFDLAFALNITSVVLVSYHLYSHDFSLLLLAILLAASALLSSSATSIVTKLLFWLSTAALFCTPLYIFGLQHGRLGYMALPVLALFGLLGWSLLEKDALLSTHDETPIGAV
jgi:hypothetical protein